MTVFAFLDNAKEAMTEFFTGLLLIAGGFLVGYLLGGLVGWALGRYAFRQQQPESLKRLGRPVGGVLLALIVAIIVFTGKGKPHGEGGDGKGSPNGETASKNGSSTVDPNTQKNPAKPPDPKQSSHARVSVLGGSDVQNERFYILNDDRNPKTLTELQDALNALMAKGAVDLELVLYPPPKELSIEHPAITRLQRWWFDKTGATAKVVKGK
jgi:hypothetical protein